VYDLSIVIISPLPEVETEWVVLPFVLGLGRGLGAENEKESLFRRIDIV